MSQPYGASKSIMFESSAEERLAKYCNRRFGGSPQITKLMGDASTRQYFRVNNKSDSFIAAAYPEAIDPTTHPYCDVTALFADAGVPVPNIIDSDGHEGIVLQEDLGDVRLQDRFGIAT